MAASFNTAAESAGGDCSLALGQPCGEEGEAVGGLGVVSAGTHPGAACPPGSSGEQR